MWDICLPYVAMLMCVSSMRTPDRVAPPARRRPYSARWSGRQEGALGGAHGGGDRALIEGGVAHQVSRFSATCCRLAPRWMASSGMVLTLPDGCSLPTTVVALALVAAT